MWIVSVVGDCSDGIVVEVVVVKESRGEWVRVSELRCVRCCLGRGEVCGCVCVKSEKGGMQMSFV